MLAAGDGARVSEASGEVKRSPGEAAGAHNHFLNFDF